ncbi:MAG: hypothetical protein FWH00_04495 [Oscillospiraceae bacterium]|nr:hypothetical protein [Oscillospiraceae bacterium]
MIIFDKLSLAHAIEPKYPGAAESLVNLTACWDEDMLYSCREDIIGLHDACRTRHDHACRFLNAAAILSTDTYRIALDSLDKNKLAAYLERLCAREIKPLRGMAGKPGIENPRLLSALTDKGIHTFTDTARLLCKKIYLISDDHGAVSRVMLHKLRSAALAAGHNIITSCCPLGPFDKLEHILIPGLGLGFMTSNRMHDLGLLIDPYRIVNSKRFMDPGRLKESKKRIAFNNKAEYQMITQAGQLITEAKKLHTELEAYYIAATDFTKVDTMTDEVIAKIERIAAGYSR